MKSCQTSKKLAASARLGSVAVSGALARLPYLPEWLAIDQNDPDASPPEILIYRERALCGIRKWRFAGVPSVNFVPEPRVVKRRERASLLLSRDEKPRRITAEKQRAGKKRKKKKEGKKDDRLYVK
mgnify:CR=1 FL=1